MRPHYRAFAVALALAATTAAFAQSSNRSASTNPISREDGLFFQSMRPQPQTFGQGAFEASGIGRPNPRGHVQVTPVPEPSQWAMMLAGLALVGFIVRRNSRKSRDQ
jgi:hypothetical protein